MCMGFGDALFFSTVQILTVSSSMKNPLTAAGKTMDVVLELWAVGVVTAVRRKLRDVLHQW